MLTLSMQCYRVLWVCRGTPTHRGAPLALRWDALVHPSAGSTCSRSLLLLFLNLSDERFGREHQG
jgi:hypothetical protein